MVAQGGGVKHIGIRVNPDLQRRFRLAANANNRSISGEVRHLIEKRVKEFEKEAA